MQKKLYNFLHKLDVGSYPINGMKLIVDETHKKNVEAIEKTAFPLETALIDYDSESDAVFFLDGSGKKNYDDVCYYLSFLTGREVDWDNTKINVSNKYVKFEFSTSLNNLFPSNFNSVSTGKLRNVLYYITNYFQSRNFEQQAFYASACINVMYDYHCKKNGFDYPNECKDILSKALDEMKDKLKKIGEPYERNKVLFDEMLRRVDVPPMSAPTKTKKMVEDIIFKRQLNDGEGKVLALSNKIRNDIVHNCCLPSPKENPLLKGLSDERILEVSMASVEVTMDVCIFFFMTNILGFSESSCHNYAEEIKYFYSERLFRGINIFQNSFDDLFEALKFCESLNQAN